MLVNEGFEDGVIDPWGTYGGVTATVVQQLVGAAVTEDPIEGSSCLHLNVAELGADFWVDAVRWYEGDYVPTN